MTLLMVVAAAAAALVFGAASGRAGANNCLVGTPGGTQTYTMHGPQSPELGRGAATAAAAPARNVLAPAFLALDSTP